ncbi:MAG: hypothetical protein IPP17_25760 [Bacteroidetes bacterium]|nr:hypothetical protein [Bacteroidota bacterium]
MRFRVGLGIVIGILLLGCQSDPKATLTTIDSLPRSPQHLDPAKSPSGVACEHRWPANGITG